MDQGQFFVVRQRRGKEGKKEKQKSKSKQKEPKKQHHSENDFTNYRISSDVILNKEDSSQSLIQSVTCPICLMILPVPYYECQICSNNFCPHCIEDWWKKSPNQCVFKCEAAQFKLIKRSNTFNAVASILKAPCQHCKKQYPVNELVDHMIKNCPEVKQYCEYCELQFLRKQIKVHCSECPKKPFDCFYCKKTFLTQQKQSHEETCEQKLLPCNNQECKEQIKRKKFQNHKEKCPFRQVLCQWCSVQLFSKDMEEHINKCDKRRVECKWCRELFKVTEILCHECALAKQICELCFEEILIQKMQNHKIQCMFQNMIQLKHTNTKLVTQNIELKEKVIMLEGIIEDSLESRKSQTLKIFKDMKEGQKKNIQRDLLRIDNSIKSIEKLKNEEFESHMKFPHLIQSWCPICRELEKKFKGMLQPLLTARKDILIKLAQVQKFSTPK